VERIAPPGPTISFKYYYKRRVMVKVKVHTLDIAPLRSESPP